MFAPEMLQCNALSCSLVQKSDLTAQVVHLDVISFSASKFVSYSAETDANLLAVELGTLWMSLVHLYHVVPQPPTKRFF